MDFETIATAAAGAAGTGVLAYLWNMLKSKGGDIAKDPSKLIAAIKAAMADGKLDAADLMKILGGFGGGNLDLQKLIDLIGKGGGGKLPDIINVLPVPTDPKMQQTLRLIQNMLAAKELADAVKDKGAPEKITFTFADGSMAEQSFKIVPKPVA